MEKILKFRIVKSISVDNANKIWYKYILNERGKIVFICIVHFFTIFFHQIMYNKYDNKKKDEYSTCQYKW